MLQSKFVPSERLVLASTSPRRAELLKQIGVDFVVVAPDYEEDMTLPVPASDLAMLLAAGKAQSVSHNFPTSAIIGADTFVTFDGKLFGKPTSAEHAVEMLRTLRGTQHQVVTGFAIFDAESGDTVSEAVTATIWMAADISDKEIYSYVDSGEPLDKAGAYAINGRGATFVDRIDGDYSAIVGLPLRPVARALRPFIESSKN